MISFVFFCNILVLFSHQYHLGPCPIGRQLRGKSCLFSGLARKRLAPTPTLSLEVFHQPTDKKQLGLFHNGQWQYVSGAPRALPVKNKKIPRWYLCFHNLGCTLYNFGSTNVARNDKYEIWLSGIKETFPHSLPLS